MSVIVEDAALAGGFTMVPNFVLRAPGLSAGAKLVYGLLLSYAWQDGSCFPGQDALAADSGVSDRTVRTYLEELKTAGLVTVKHRGLGLTALYTLVSQNPREARKPASAQSRTPDSTLPGSQLPPRGGRQLPTTNTQSTKTQRTNSGPPASRIVRTGPGPGSKYTQGRYAVCGSCGARPCLCAASGIVSHGRGG